MTIYEGAPTGVRRQSLLQQVLGTAGAGAAGALVVVAFSPFSAATAAFSPPLYALIAGAYSIVPFLARRLLGYPWAATTVGIVAAVLAAPFSPIGMLIVVLFVGAGAAYDSVSWALTRGRADRVAPAWVSVVAALVSALVLFLVSFPVLSPEHRVPLILAATFGGRAIGQVGAVAIAGGVGRLLGRRGGAERGKTGV
ncbi:hypothetical protein KNO15_22000 [Leifsonia shinshuensis]|uniref:hypothetical protein n=1 Tax=Leifsonia shinshuensis TaxID=150026 RepID=UPI001F514001|nr:hypothetical protein [Leifsonia shinshuensis]MCI0159384.1 hypothetical protein [Leifsonia shinshuensis]